MYSDHLPIEQVEELLKSGDLVKGKLRVPKSKYDQAYVTDPADSKQDFLIQGRSAMNRALTGDTVAIR